MADPGQSKTRAKVLVVDDEENVLELLVEILAAEGHETERALDGFQGLEMVRGNDFDLVITDCKMPRMTGVELYREAKKARPGIERRFVFVSGEIDDEERAAIAKETGAPFVAKPFRIGEIQSAVVDCLTDNAKL